MLSLLPTWVYVAVATAFVVLGIVIRVIGIPGTPIPKFVTNILGTILVVVGVFAHGGIWTQQEFLKEIEKAKQEIARIEAESKKISERVVVQYKDRIVTIREQGEQIVKEVPVYITKESDAKCDVPNGFVVLHDSASQNEVPRASSSTDGDSSGVALSQVATTVVGNYTTCHEVRAQLKALQDWVKLQQDNYNGIKK